MLHRPTRLWARDDATGPVTLRQRFEYGDGGRPDQPAARRDAARAQQPPRPAHPPPRRGRPYRRRAVDFKGNVLDKSRRVIADAPILAVFDAGARQQLAGHALPGGLATRPSADARRPRRRAAGDHGSTRRPRAYDALNRVKRMRFPRTSRASAASCARIQPRWRSRAGLARRHALRRAHRLRRQGPARADRLRQRRDDPLRLRPADVPPQAAAQRALHQTERVTYPPDGEALQDYGYDYDLVGNILAIRDRTPGSGIPQQSRRGRRADSAFGPTAGERRRAQPPLRLRPDLSPALGDRPRMRPPARRTTHGTSSRAAPISPRRARTPSAIPMTRWATCCASNTSNGAGGFTREFTVETAQQPPAAK